MIHKLNPCYQIPSRKYFSQEEIARLYNEVKESVDNRKLKEMEFSSETTDLWSSRAMHPYLSYTIQFVDEEWKLPSLCLETVPMFEDHTGINIIDSIKDILSNWQISSEKLAATTTDNGNNFAAGFNISGWT